MSLNLEDLNTSISREKMIVLKNILTPLEYFVMYYFYLSLDYQSINSLKKLFNLSDNDINNIVIDSKNKIKQYSNEKLYQEKIIEIKQREKGLLGKIKTKPISPLSIIRYHYLKQYLNPLEINLYYLNTLSNYNYTKKEYADKLNISLAELEQLAAMLKTKMTFQLSKSKLFANFRKKMVDKYSLNIYSLCPKEETTKTINYSNLKDTYDCLSYEEILNMVKNYNITLTKQEDALLKKYFSIPKLPNISVDSINYHINLLKYKLSNKDKMYQVFLCNKNSFSLEETLYLMCYIFNKYPKKLFTDKYPYSYFLKDNKPLLSKLETIYNETRLDLIYSIYQNNYDNMSLSKRNIYTKYLSSNKQNNIPETILLDIIKSLYPDYFDIKNSQIDEVLNILFKYKNILPLEITNSLLSIYEIPYSEIMSGKEKNHIYRIFNRIEDKKTNNKKLTLTK